MYRVSRRARWHISHWLVTDVSNANMSNWSEMIALNWQKDDETSKNFFRFVSGSGAVQDLAALFFSHRIQINCMVAMTCLATAPLQTSALAVMTQILQFSIHEEDLVQFQPNSIQYQRDGRRTEIKKHPRKRSDTQDE